MQLNTVSRNSYMQIDLLKQASTIEASRCVFLWSQNYDDGTKLMWM